MGGVVVGKAVYILHDIGYIYLLEVVLFLFLFLFYACRG